MINHNDNKNEKENRSHKYDIKIPRSRHRVQIY